MQFQFHTGSIKSREAIGNRRFFYTMFQFHTGSIKSEQSEIDDIDL